MYLLRIGEEGIVCANICTVLKGSVQRNLGQKWYQSKDLSKAYHRREYNFKFIKGTLCNLQKISSAYVPGDDRP